MSGYKDLFMGVGEFSNILTSCIEVYPRETIGLLAGEITSRRIILKLAYPVQMARRRKSYIILKSEKNFRRTIRILDSLGLEFFGFYHSHPEGKAIPSETDLIHSIDQLIEFEEKRPLLELIVEIKQKKYRRKHKKDFEVWGDDNIFEGWIKDTFSRFDYKFVGHWIEISELEYGIVPNIYSASLNFLEGEVRETWPER
jgi:proteasome lid subunit RPN8/RPN11